MRLTQNVELGSQERVKGRPWAGWMLVVALSAVELAAVLWGKPSVLGNWPPLEDFVARMGEAVPLVQNFARCAEPADAGVGLMLAVGVAFFPLKLAALYLAHPTTLSTDRPDRVFAWFYMLLLGVVALVPAYVYGWIFGPGDHGLLTLARKTSTLCRGGLAAFFVAMFQSGFALVCAYVSLAIFVSGIGRMIEALRNPSMAP